MSFRRPRRKGALVGAALALCSFEARADESSAEKLFRDGRALMLEQRFAEACPLLAESQRLEPHVGTLLNLAACHESEQKVASAWVEYQKALTAARAEGQAERVTLAEKRIAVLEPRVPWLRIDAGGGTVSLDGSPLAPDAVGKELPVDPGTHLVHAERAAVPAFEERLELREGEHRTVVVRFAETTAPERLVVEPKAVAESPSVPAPAQKKSRWTFELGVFAAYLLGTIDRVAAPQALYPSEATLTDDTGTQTSCGANQCDLGAIREADGLTAGVNLFGGYAITDSVDLGARFIAGPEIGPAGGSVIAVGPAVRFHASDAISLGAWALLGNATMKGKAVLFPPPGYRASESFVSAEGSLEGGPGVGLELSVRLFEIGRGAVIASTTPFLIAGSGTGFCLPASLGYRFQ